MGIQYNTRSIESGLVLKLDPSNTKSYPGIPSVRALIVGGGGGGGMDMGGGGGGGGVIDNTAVPITPGVGMTVTVGAGGWGAPAGSGGYRGDGVGPQPASHQFTIPATDGGNSSFGGFTAYGGGHGASSYFYYLPDYIAANGMPRAGNGGCGGGMSGYSNGTYKAGGKGIAGQGYDGGQGGPQYYSGGGGGAGAKGTDSFAVPHGGTGKESSINGTSYYWGGGGGGAAYSVSPGGNGGNGGGGGGAVGTTTGGAGLNPGSAGGGGVINSQSNKHGGNAGANTGGGGGGGSHYNATNQGGNGGSGIVIIRYPGVQNATGGTVTTVGSDTVHTFTSSGTFTPSSPWYGLDDTSGKGNNGILINGSVVSTISGVPQIVFDGTNDYWKTNGTTPVSLQGDSNFTVFGFFRRTGTIVNRGSWAIGSGVSLQGICNWNYSNTNEITIDLWGTSTFSSGQTYPLNSWVGVHWTKTAGVFSRANTAIVVGNTKYTSTGLSVLRGGEASAVSINTSGVYLGSIDTSTSYNSAINIGYLAIYDRVLTDAEMLSNYNAFRGRFGL